MKNLILILSILFSLHLFAGTPAKYVAVGSTLMCMASDTRVKCDLGPGDSRLDLDLDGFSNIRGLVAGLFYACAIDDEGVWCWSNYDDSPLFDFPRDLEKPEVITGGLGHACLLENRKVVCWGAIQGGEAAPSDLKPVLQVSAGWNHTCALQIDNKVVCWGDPDIVSKPIPKLKNPRLIESGGYATCALDDEGVKCWGLSQENEDVTYVPPLKNPRLLSVGGEVRCAVDDEGLKCWGYDSFKLGKLISGAGKNIKSLSVESADACILDDNGVKCWSVGKHVDLPREFK